MSLEEKKLNQDEGVRGLLKKEDNDKISQILSFGERHKKRGEEMMKEFWNQEIYGSIKPEFISLVLGYEERKKEFIDNWLYPEERETIRALNEQTRERFYRQYCYNQILYSGSRRGIQRISTVPIIYPAENLKLEGLVKWIHDIKGSLKPGSSIDLNSLFMGDERVGVLAKEWKDSLKPGMQIELWGNEITENGIKILAKEWKNSLQPGMYIGLGVNNFGYEGVEVLAKEWKNSLQPGIEIGLSGNNIGDEGVKILAEEWRDSLKHGMTIQLHGNGIGDEGVKALAEEWKDKLQPGMTINLWNNDISKRGIKILAEKWKNSLKPGMRISLGDVSNDIKEELEKWEKDNIKKGINCKITV